jgi:hypothetical protein
MCTCVPPFEKSQVDGRKPERGEFARYDQEDGREGNTLQRKTQLKSKNGKKVNETKLVLHAASNLSLHVLPTWLLKPVGFKLSLCCDIR